MSYTVAQNTSFLTIASILQKVISSVYFIIIARTIGTHNNGDYFTIITSIAIFTVIADFGITAVLTREVSKYPEKTEQYFQTAFYTKFIFGLATLGLIYLSKIAFNYPSQPFPLIVLAGCTMFFDNLQMVFYGTLRSKKNLLFEAIGIICSQTLTLLIGTIVILNHWPLMWLIAAYTIPSLIINFYSALCLRIRYRISLLPRFDKQVFKTLIALAWPFALAGIISRFFSYNDSIIMNSFLTPHEIGVWGAAYKIAAAFQFIPITLSVSVFPAMSSLVTIDIEKIKELYKRSFHYLLLVAFPLGLGTIALAEPLVLKFLKTDFQESIPVLQLLMISLILGFLSFINGAVLNSLGKQKVQTTLMFFTLLISVVGNLVLIPWLGIKGAALVSVVSNLFLSGMGVYLVHKSLGLVYRDLAKIVVQLLLPAGVMSLLVYYVAQRTNFLLTVPLGAFVYGVLLFLTGGISWSLILEFKNKLLHKKSPVV